MSEEKTYQPHWGEKREHRHHHHHSGTSRKRYEGLKSRDRQAYIGLMLVLIAAIGFGAYKLVMLFVDEIRAMPMDDPDSEMAVDELRIHKAEEQDALQFSDSLSQATHLDSIRRKVQIDTRPVYRPPKKENKWYITQREWKTIWKEYKVMRWERKHAKKKAEEERNKQDSNKEDSNKQKSEQ